MNFILPVISKQEAQQIFSKRKIFFRRSPGEIVNLELIHFPYYTFEVTVKTKKGEQKVSISVDGISGTFAFLNLDKVTISEEGAGSFDFEFSFEEAEKIGKREYKGVILQSGLLAKTPSELKEIRKTYEIYYPFWVCYYKKRNLYDFSALDAVNGKIEGIKMKPVFLKAFSQKNE